MKNRIGIFLLAALTSAAAFGAGTTDNVFQVGKPGTATTKRLRLGSGEIRHDAVNSKLQFSANGTDFKDIGSGSGGSGGINLITDNPDFESGAVNWTASGGAFAVVTSGANLANGGKTASFTPSALSQNLTSTAYPVTGGLATKSCLGAIYYKTAESTNKYILQVISGTSTVEASTTLDPSADAFTWGYVPFSCPALATNIKLRVLAASTLPTNPIYFDDAHLGSENRFGTFSQSSIYGGAKSPVTASCIWSSTSGTFGDFAADADCPVMAATGNASAPDTKIPGIKFANLPAGDYVVVVQAPLMCTRATNNCNAGWRISDGTNNGSYMQNYVVATGATSVEMTANTLMGRFTYTSPQTNVTFRIQSGAMTTTAFVKNDFSDMEFIVYRYPLNGETGMRVDQINWQVDGLIQGANITMNPNVAVSNTTLENASLSWTQQNGSLAATIACSGTNVSTGTTCAAGNEQVGVVVDIPRAGKVEVCADFQVNSNSGELSKFVWYRTADGSQTPLEYSFDSPAFGIGTGSGTWPIHYCGVLNATQGKNAFRLLYNNVLGAGSGSTHQMELANSGGAGVAMIRVRPLDYSSGAFPAFKGLPSVGDSVGIKFAAAFVNASSVVSNEVNDMISGNCTGVNGDRACSFRAGLWTVAPSCIATVSATNPAAEPGNTHPARITNITASDFNIYTRDTANASVAYPVSIFCWGI